MKRVPDLRRSAIEFDQRSSIVYSQRRESLRIQPILHRLQIGFGRTKLLSKFLWCQPGMKFRRIGILLIGGQPLQRGLLVRAPLPATHAFWSLVAARAGSRGRSQAAPSDARATQRHHFIVLDGLDNSRCGATFCARAIPPRHKLALNKVTHAAHKSLRWKTFIVGPTRLGICSFCAGVRQNQPLPSFEHRSVPEVALGPKKTAATPNHRNTNFGGQVLGCLSLYWGLTISCLRSRARRWPTARPHSLEWCEHRRPWRPGW